MRSLRSRLTLRMPTALLAEVDAWAATQPGWAWPGVPPRNAAIVELVRRALHAGDREVMQ